MPTLAKVHLPQLSGHSGKIRWAKAVGDSVAKGDKLLDLDFESIQVPVPSPFAGRVQTQVVREGHGANSGAIIAMIERTDAAAPGPIDVCATCGVVRVADATACARCSQPYATPLSLPRATASWVSIECKLKCRLCGFVVPLNHLELGDAVTCVRCGLQQAFDARGWHDGLAHAHGVADGMSAAVGRSRASASHTVPTDNQLEITASPGFPLCATCRAPRQVELATGVATCATCATTDACAVPPAARELTNGALLAVLIAAHRDHAPVRVEQTQGAIAIHCPSCSAPLAPTEGTKFIVCAFCQTTARIPDGILFKISGIVPASEPMWLAFHGPSAARDDAEQEHIQQQNRGLAKAIADAQDKSRGVREKTRHKAQADKQAAREQAKAQAETATGAKQNRRSMWIVLGVVVVVIAMVAIFAMLDHRTH